MKTIPDTTAGATSLIGRSGELAVLGEHFARAAARQGSVVLIGGEAGIGKTALAGALASRAADAGATVLWGRCYDRAEQSAYALWANLGPPPTARGAVARAVPLPWLLDCSDSAAQPPPSVYRQATAWLGEASAGRPLVLVLEDLHWADAASLDLLLHLGRGLRTHPVLLVATLRPDEVGLADPLCATQALLVRDAEAVRMQLHPLDRLQVGEILSARHGLAPDDGDRLLDYVFVRAGGNPLFVHELLRALVEERLLVCHGDRWTLAPLENAQLPRALRLLILGRITRLGTRDHQLLTGAAVVGEEVELAVWAAVMDTTEEALVQTIERATAAGVLDSAADGLRVHFCHAVVRQALYDDCLPARRRAWHLRAAAVIAAGPAPDPDLVASHYGHARDARAADWLIAAGERAQRSGAWTVAADRLSAALDSLGEAPGRDATRGDATRGWLHLRVALLRRQVDQQAGAHALARAEQLAWTAGDRLLAAHVRCARGLFQCWRGQTASGVEDLRAGVEQLAAGAGSTAASTAAATAAATAGAGGSAPPGGRDEVTDVARATIAVSPVGDDPRGVLTLWLALSGRLREARIVGEALLAARGGRTGHLDGTRCSALLPAEANACRGLALAYAATGEATGARALLRRARDLYRLMGNPAMEGEIAVNELEWIVLPFETELRTARREAAGLAAAAWRRADQAQGPVNAAAAGLLLDELEGRWEDVTAIASAEHGLPQTLSRTQRARLLGAIHQARGDWPAAWREVHYILPDGPNAAPGSTLLLPALQAQVLAAGLAVACGDTPSAVAWLEAHDRWIAWSGATAFRPRARLSWAELHHAAGEPEAARTAAERAVALATTPRQPLVLLRAHRLLGLLALAGCGANAAAHLQQSLALAEACDCPVERAQCLAALAHDGAAGAARLLDEARTLLDRLGILPARGMQATVAHLAEKTVRDRAASCDSLPGGLSPREAEVLRLIASGARNQDIATDLCISVRTVERHVNNLYRKIGARGKAAATAFAFQSGLATHS